MRTLGLPGRARARRPLAFPAFAALVLFSGPAFAECTGSPGVNISASFGATCIANGAYVSSDVIAGQATGTDSVLTNVLEGPNPVSFSTSGDNTPAVQADGGGSVTVILPPSTLPTVTTTGSGSIGLYATGTDESGTPSSIVVQNVNVSTQGANANAVQADSGGSVSVTGGSAVTSGIDAFGVRATSGATVTLSGGSFQTNGMAAVGIVVTGATTTLTASGTSITTTGGVDLSGNAAEGLYNGPSTTDATGGTVTLTNSTITTSGVGSGGIVEESGSLTMTGGSIATTGVNAAGVLNIGGFLDALGGTITLNNVALTTAGANSFGLQTNDQGITNLNGGSVATTGQGSGGVLSIAGGSTAISGTQITTTGDNAVGLQASGPGSNMTVSNATTVSTTGANANGLEADSGATIAMTGGSITTIGPTSLAVFASTGASITLTGTTITANGNGEQPLFLTGPGSSIIGSGLTITSNGTTDPGTGFNSSIASNGYGVTPNGGVLQLTNSTMLTTGAFNFGVSTSNTGVTTLTNDSITSTGANATGVGSNSGGQTIINGGSITIAGANGTGVGAFSGGQVTMNGGSVTMNGANSNGFAVYSVGSSVLATGVTLTTNAAAIPSENSYVIGLSISSGGAVTFSGGSITANGASDTAANVSDGGSLTLPGGTTILTTGPGAAGIVSSTGASVVATGLTLTTTGGMDPTDGDVAAGFYNSGTLNLTNSTVTTSGANANGVVTFGGGTTTINGGSITTSGANAIGLESSGTGSSVTTTNLEEIGPITISTSGANANGVQADGGGQVTLNGGSVTTTGPGSVGLFANGTDESGAPSQITATNVTVSGATGTFGHALFAYQGGQITMTGGSASTAGASDYVVGVYQGGRIDLTGTTISATADGSGGVFINGTGGVLNATNVTITTGGGVDLVTGNSSDGAFNGSYPGVPGGGTMTFTNSSITTSGPHAHGVNTQDAGVTNVFGGSITTSGDQSDAVLALSGAQVTVQGTTISTSGDAAKGFDIVGTGTVVTISDVAVTTTGTIDSETGFHAQALYDGDGTHTGTSPTGGGVAHATNSAFVTRGDDTPGVDTLDGGVTTLSGGSVLTSGARSAAVVASSSAFVSLAGVTVATSGNGSSGLRVVGGGEIDAANSAIATQGGIDPSSGDRAHGAFNGPNTTFATGGVLRLTDTSVTTQGDQILGVGTSTGGTTTILGGSVATAGFISNAVLSENGGSTTVGVSAVGGTRLTTSGNDSAVVVAELGGSVSLDGATVSAMGAMGSSGLVVHDAGSELDATNVTVSTAGVADPSTGRGSVGAFNGPFGTSAAGGVMKLINTSISTQGAGMGGVVTGAGGVTTITGGSVSTAGEGARAVVANAPGATINLAGSPIFTTSGAGAIGLYAALGGVVAADSASTTTITTLGGVSSTTGLSAYGVNADGAGSKITLGAATITTSGPGAFGLYASDAASSGTAGSISATGALTIKTNNASATAVGLQGNGATILATGGGAITSAGNAISLTGGTNQTATFDNFKINNLSGNLVFADPSVSTVNFNNTTADAGLNNLLDATGGSIVTLNANASILTGAISTDPTSTSNVNLTNGTIWNLTGPSTVSNLSVANSVIVFAPPNSGVGFKTLTVGNYAGSGANIIMNAALGGSNSGSDQIIVNGGVATGTTFLTIKNAGGAGGQTTGAGIPVVITTNGGTIASNAFSLANTPVVGGFRYSLDETNDSFYLVSTPTTTQGQVQNSVNNVAKAQQTQLITNRVLGSILLGATEQISCSSCGSGFGSIGSLALGAHGRLPLSDQLTAMGGISYNQWSSNGISVYDAPTVAGSLVYDFSQLGSSRPFIEVGGGLTPYEQVKYSRNYPNGNATALGTATAVDRDLTLFARVGWIARLGPVDEAAVYGDLSRNWMQTGGYSEALTSINPYPASVAPGLDTLNVVRVGGQYTHLFFGNIEANVTAGVAYGFGAGSGNFVNINDFGPIQANALPNTTWLEYGARLGYRFSDRVVVDAFVLGTAFGEVGTTVHGGIGLRFSF